MNFIFLYIYVLFSIYFIIFSNFPSLLLSKGMEIFQGGGGGPWGVHEFINHTCIPYYRKCLKCNQPCNIF